MIVIKISCIILNLLKTFERNSLAYLDYDYSYDRNTVIVLATKNVQVILIQRSVERQKVSRREGAQ